MATQDVPGFGNAQHDELKVGVWGEHTDGSLVLIEGVEQGRVIYSIFDMEVTPPIEYRDSLPERQFKRQFSFSSGDSIVDDGWQWHDKTQFPWNKIMDHFPDGTRFPSADAVINEASRIARARALKGNILNKRDKAHLMDQIGRKGKIIVDKVQRAISELRA